MQSRGGELCCRLVFLGSWTLATAPHPPEGPPRVLAADHRGGALVQVGQPLKVQA